MSYDYYGYGALAAVLALIGVIAVVVAIASYVISGLALSKMAKNAGIENPWLAWVPIAQLYILGMLAERSYRFHYGKALPVSFAIILPVAQGINYAVSFLIGGGFSTFVGLLTAVCVGAGCYLVFKDYTPGKETLYTVLAVIISISYPILLLINKDNVPVSVTGTGFAAQPKYDGTQPPQPFVLPQAAPQTFNQQPPQGYQAPQQPPQGYGQAPQQPPQGYGQAPQQPPQAPTYGAPQAPSYDPPSYNPPAPEAPQPEEHKGPEL